MKKLTEDERLEILDRALDAVQVMLMPLIVREDVLELKHDFTQHIETHMGTEIDAVKRNDNSFADMPEERFNLLRRQYVRAAKIEGVKI